MPPAAPSRAAPPAALLRAARGALYAAAGSMETSPRHNTILAIDDDVSVLALIRDSLCGLLHTDIHTTPSPVYGFEIALKTQPDLIICDFFMPRLDAATFFALLTATFDNWRPLPRRMPPFLLIAGRGDAPEVRALAAEPGVAGFLRKPFTPESLIERAAKALGVEPLPGRMPSVPMELF